MEVALPDVVFDHHDGSNTLNCCSNDCPGLEGMFDAEDQQDAEPIEGCLRNRVDIGNGGMSPLREYPHTLLKMNLCRRS